MVASNTIKELVGRVPDLEKAAQASETDMNKRRDDRWREGKLTGPDWQTAQQQIFDPILAAGAQGIVEVINMLQANESGSDYKARYVLHGLTVYVSCTGAGQRRKMLAQALASQLDTNRPKSIKGFLIRELQGFAGPEVVESIGLRLSDDELCADAAAALQVIRDGATAQLLKALPQCAGRARLTVIQTLGELGDTESLPALRQAIEDADRDVREMALWALNKLSASEKVDTDNKLTDAERLAGWKLLFNGEDHTGWMTNKGPEIKTPIEDGCLLPYKSGGYIVVHEQQWENFILQCDVKMTPPACNSGVFFRVSSLKNPVHSGFEMAVNRGGKGLHSFGAVYDLVPSRDNFLRGLGKFDTVQIKCLGPTIDVHVNGRLTAEMNCDEWPHKGRRPDDTKHKFKTAIKDLPHRGYLGFQDHGKKVWYKNVKLLELNLDGSTKK